MNLAVFSLWTQTSMFRVERGPLLIHSLAIERAKQCFSKVHFITDAGGNALAESLGWRFDHVALDLDSLRAEGMLHIWALGKLVAVSIQKEPFIHMDGDVVLTSPLSQELKSARLVAQSRDYPHYYHSEEMNTAYQVSGIRRGYPKYNCGIIGGADNALLRSWALHAYEKAQLFANNPLNGTTTSMMIEQASLGAWADYCGVKVATIIDSPDDQDGARRAGYNHLAGNAKRNPEIVARAEATFARVFPEAYKRFNDGFATLVPSLTLEVESSSSSSNSSAEVAF